jgi:5'(3')-deoxyribonucleotidase
MGPAVKFAGPGAHKPKKKRIAVDMDEVLADALGEHIRLYNRDFGTRLTKADLKNNWLSDVVPEDQRVAVSQYLHTAEFFADLDVMEDSQRVMQRLAERYEIFIASAAMAFPNSFAPKFHWLKRHFPWVPPSHIVFCGDKGILLADYLIDDMPWNLERFHGEGVLFSAPHNLRYDGFRRVETWREIEDIFL